MSKTEPNERNCIDCGTPFRPLRLDDVFIRVDPEKCPECAAESRGASELWMPIVTHQTTGTTHAVTQRPYNENGHETACGLVIKDVPRTATPADVECGNCKRALKSYE